MEDNLNFFTKWKTNSTFQPNEDNLIFYYKMDAILNFVYNPNGRRAHFCSKIEDDLNVFKIKDDLNFQQSGRQPLFSTNGRRPQYFTKGKTTPILTKWKTTLIFYKMEDTSFLLKVCEQKMTSNY